MDWRVRETATVDLHHRCVKNFALLPVAREGERSRIYASYRLRTMKQHDYNPDLRPLLHFECSFTNPYSWMLSEQPIRCNGHGPEFKDHATAKIPRGLREAPHPSLRPDEP